MGIKAQPGRALFADRRAAGRALAARLSSYAGRDDVRVLALPRGGVPVAFEVAEALGAPLDVWVVRKLGFPGEEEVAMGAIAAGVRVLNPALADALAARGALIEHVEKREQIELARRERLYREDREPLSVTGKIAIVIDDGLATGATMLAAVESLRALGPAKIVVGVPVSPPEACALIARAADDTVCAVTPQAFVAVGRWYDDFTQTSDDEVESLLAEALVSWAQHNAPGEHARPR